MTAKKTCSKVVFALAIAAALLMGHTASANSTNTVPFQYSFEGLADGDSIVGTNGWYGETNTYATATNDTYTYSPGTYPISTTHGTHVVLDTENGTLTNLFNEIDTTDPVFFDMMMLPTRWSDEEYPTMTNDTSIELGLFFNSNGNPVVYHAFDLFSTVTNRFTVIPDVTLDSNTWARITITQSNIMGTAVSQIQIDGTPITNAAAYTPAPAYGGSWFANADYNANDGLKLSSVSISGTGFLDDFVVTYDDPFGITTWLITASINNSLGGSVSPSGSFSVNDGSSTTITVNVSNFWDHVTDVDGTNQDTRTIVTFANVTAPHTVTVAVTEQTTTSVAGVDVPRWWLNDYAGDPDVPDGNPDSDIMSNWEEWLASTDPNDSNSVFEIVEHYVTGGTGHVVWVSKSIDPSLPPFAVLRSTNLTDTGGGWTVVDDSVSRGAGAGGTNLWMDTSPPAAAAPVYYRVSATN